MKPIRLLMALFAATALCLRSALGGREECHNVSSTCGKHRGGKVPFVTEEAFATRYLLAKKGTAANGILNGTANAMPWGVCEDEPASGVAAEVAVLGAFDGTMLVTGNAAIAAGVEVYTAAAGKVSALTATPGTYYKVGRLITACAADGGFAELAPCYPVATVVS